MKDNSFEFFPPRTAEGKAKLRTVWEELAQLKPRFFSCTFGAGGSTREGTLETVLEIRKAGHEAAPHISCVASSRKDIADQLERYRASGIRHVVALRGDLPSGLAASGEFRHADELVAFIRETTGDWFRIEVACYPEFHPQTRSAELTRKLTDPDLRGYVVLRLREDGTVTPRELRFRPLTAAERQAREAERDPALDILAP